MRILGILSVSLLSLSSCKQKDNSRSINKQGDWLKAKKIYFSTKPTNYYFEFDKSKSNIQNFDSGFVDTFSIRSTRFKLFSNPDSSGDLELRVFKNGYWLLNTKIPYGINGMSYDIDFNKDGFNEFQNSLLRGSQIYLFDTAKLEFHSEPISLAFEWTIIDSSQKIFSNNYELSGIYQTNLFKLNGYRQKFLYTAELDYKVTTIKTKLFVRLYRVMKNDLTDTVFISQQHFDLKNKSFDYKKYWLTIIKNHQVIN